MNENASSGVGFPGLLAVLFIGLKLTHFIDWPWLLVLSPIWIPFLFLIFLLTGFCGAALIAAMEG